MVKSIRCFLVSDWTHGKGGNFNHFCLIWELSELDALKVYWDVVMNDNATLTGTPEIVEVSPYVFESIISIWKVVSIL